jgi:hypothetical protein
MSFMVEVSGVCLADCELIHIIDKSKQFSQWKPEARQHVATTHDLLHLVSMVTRAVS